jgi:hypothetical protein
MILEVMVRSSAPHAPPTTRGLRNAREVKRAERSGGKKKSLGASRVPARGEIPCHASRVAVAVEGPSHSREDQK